MGKIYKVSLTVFVREDEERQIVSDLNTLFCENEAMLWGGRIDSTEMSPDEPDADAIRQFLYQDEDDAYQPDDDYGSEDHGDV